MAIWYASMTTAERREEQGIEHRHANARLSGILARACQPFLLASSVLMASFLCSCFACRVSCCLGNTQTFSRKYAGADDHS